MDIRIDTEFKNELRPLTEEEYKKLEYLLTKYGCRDSLVLWGNTLVDGHNRYEICERLGIPYKTTQIDFASREEVKEWIHLNNEARRNITIHEIARATIEQNKQRIAERAKENLHQGQKPLQNSANPIDTRSELARIAGVSHDTIAKVEKIESDAPIQVRDASRKGDISVNSAYQVTKMEPEEQNEVAVRIEQGEPAKEVIQQVKSRVHVSYNGGNNEWYTPEPIIELARKTMGDITLDPASCEYANETVKAETYFSIDDNGLEHDWCGNIWLNPPYSSDLIGRFADKVISEREHYEQAIVLVNNATETEWFRKLVSVASTICFPHSRVKYHTPDGKTGAPLQGQAIFYVGNNQNEFVKNFSSIGWIAEKLHDLHK